jgi:hypothetical protein
MRRPNGSVLIWHDIPPAVSLPGNRKGHDLTLGIGSPGGLGDHPPAAVETTLSLEVIQTH